MHPDWWVVILGDIVVLAAFAATTVTTASGIKRTAVVLKGPGILMPICLFEMDRRHTLFKLEWSLYISLNVGRSRKSDWSR